jgi:hypothetical protein
MTSSILGELAEEWIVCKQQETEWTNKRRDIEDQLMQSDEIVDGTNHLDQFGLVVKVTTRLNRRIDSDKLQEIAAESGLTNALSILFRWKPEINAAAWKSADPETTEPLLDAITTSEGRPSFKISKQEKED